MSGAFRTRRSGGAAPDAPAAFQPWSERAACLNQDPELWFPERGESNKAAKRICASCPVKVPCLEYAMAAHEPYGVWGGLSEQERSRLNRRQVA